MPLQEKSWKEFQPAAQWKIISLQTSAAWITSAFQDFQRSTCPPCGTRGSTPASQQVFLLPRVVVKLSLPSETFQVLKYSETTK